MRDWDTLHGSLRDQGLSEYRIRELIAGGLTLSGFGPRPLAVLVVWERLQLLSDDKERSALATALAETCYECFSIEDLFRRLLDRDPTDTDLVQTALVNLDVHFDHIGWHLRDLKSPLKDVLKRLDSIVTVEKTEKNRQGATDLRSGKHGRHSELKRLAEMLSELSGKKPGRTWRDWEKFEVFLREEGWPVMRIRAVMAAGRLSGCSQPQGLRFGATRPLIVPVVEQRLGAISDTGKRGELAIELAETCYECFSIEDQFRELLECDPRDNDRILTALVNLDLQLDHIRWHIRELKRPLEGIIKALDPMADKQVLANFLGRPVAGTRPRPGRRSHEWFKQEAEDFLAYAAKKTGRSWHKGVRLLTEQGWSRTHIKDFLGAAEEAGIKTSDFFKKGR